LLSVTVPYTYSDEKHLAIDHLLAAIQKYLHYKNYNYFAIQIIESS
jgi:hypothetical protein